MKSRVPSSISSRQTSWSAAWAPVKQALEDAKITEQDIDEVILVGGSTRIPAVQALVRRLNSAARRAEPMGQPGRGRRASARDPGGCLAGEVKRGAARRDAALLGVETLGGVMTKLIERNTTIPARKSETFSTAEDNQPRSISTCSRASASWRARTVLSATSALKASDRRREERRKSK